jgi:L-lactate dehydrogenase complex protein LldE
VTYHPTCHSLRMLRVGDAPLKLLKAVRGIDLVELPQADECCGFGGTFAVKNADTSMAMLGSKVRCILDTKAEMCASADNSCLMQIGGALHRQRAGVGTIHLAEILAATEGDVEAESSNGF